MGLEDRKPAAFIFDIDGTVLRSLEHAYLLIRPVSAVLHSLRWNDYAVLLVTGHPEEERERVRRQLSLHSVTHDKLYMRPPGDTRPVDLVKRDIYLNEIQDQYEVLGAFGDSLAVNAMWRRHGILTFDVSQR